MVATIREWLAIRLDCNTISRSRASAGTRQWAASCLQIQSRFALKWGQTPFIQTSLDFEADLADDAGPFLMVRLQPRGELGRRAADRLEPGGGKAFAHLW